MERLEMEKMLARVAAGEVSVDEAASQLAFEPFSDLGYAKVDHHRGIRQGVSEVIFGAGKTPAQIAGIAKSMLGSGQERILVTRLSRESAEEVSRLMAWIQLPSEAEKMPEAFTGEGGHVPPADADSPQFVYDELSRIGRFGDFPEKTGVGTIVVATAGTSDLPVAEEAALTAEMLGNEVKRLYDVGVAGLHRLLAHGDDLASASVVVVVAGMEGALPSVVGGLVACPVIAVPTSVGYGASFGGLAALLAMLNCCASGVSVVNIDNGFGAGYQASLINHVK